MKTIKTMKTMKTPCSRRCPGTWAGPGWWAWAHCLRRSLAPPVHRINGTRALRAIITRLRRQGPPICSQSRTAGGGYYLAAAGSELEDYCERLRKKALKGLCIEALLRQTTLPELLGQIILSVTHDVDISCRA